MARSGDWITAGDGLGAFGAALIVAVQICYEAPKAAAAAGFSGDLYGSSKLAFVTAKENQSMQFAEHAYRCANSCKYLIGHRSRGRDTALYYPNTGQPRAAAAA